jgi:hypothetical protein
LKFGYRQQIIHLREKNIAGPTERSEDANASSKLAEEDLRFSMKMMFVPVSETPFQFNCRSDSIPVGRSNKLLQSTGLWYYSG